MFEFTSIEHSISSSTIQSFDANQWRRDIVPVDRNRARVHNITNTSRSPDDSELWKRTRCGKKNSLVRYGCCSLGFGRRYILRDWKSYRCHLSALLIAARSGEHRAVPRIVVEFSNKVRRQRDPAFGSTRFHLSGAVDEQNFRYRSRHGPRELQPATVPPSHGYSSRCVWSVPRWKWPPIAVARCSTIFFGRNRTIFFHEYGTRKRGGFNKTVHSAFREKRFLGVSCPLRWPLRSPDLNPCDFFLRDDFKAQVYRHRPHTFEALKEVITRKARNDPRVHRQLPRKAQSVYRKWGPPLKWYNFFK